MRRKMVGDRLRLPDLVAERLQRVPGAGGDGGGDQDDHVGAGKHLTGRVHGGEEHTCPHHGAFGRDQRYGRPPWALFLLQALLLRALFLLHDAPGACAAPSCVCASLVSKL